MTKITHSQWLLHGEEGELDVDGLGWCNDQTNEAYLITDPLYDGINE